MGRRLHRQGGVRVPVELAQPALARRLPRPARHRRHPGHRHARAHAPPARSRRAGGHHLHRRDRRRRASSSARAAARARRPRSRQRGRGAGAARLDRGRAGSSAAATAPPPAPRFRVVAFDSGIKQQHPAPARGDRLRASTWCRQRRRSRPCWSEAGRGLPLQRARRSRGGGLPRADSARAAWAARRSSASASGHQILGLAARRQHVQAQVRPPRRQPPGARHRQRARGDHRAEPRLRRGPEVGRARRLRRDAREPQRRDVGGHAAPRAAGVLGAVPPGGLAGPARRALSLRPVHRPDEGRGARGGGATAREDTVACPNT